MRLLFAIVAFFGASASAQAVGRKCVNLFAGQVDIVFAEPGLEVNRMPAIHYDLDLTLANLQLTRADLRAMEGKILLLGDGFSDLLPTLVEMGKDVRSLDVVYRLSGIPGGYWYSQKYRDYLSRNRSRLIASPVAALAVPDNSQNHILSHMLISSLWINDDLSQIFGQAIRALAPGGIAVFAWYSSFRNFGFFKRMMRGFSDQAITYSFSSNGKEQPYIPDHEFEALIQQMDGRLPPRWDRDHSEARVQVLKIEKHKP
jgi:SAM-dependent methyltransferase